MAEIGWDARAGGLSALPIRPKRPIEWELDADGDKIRLHLPSAKRDVWFRARIGPVLEALAEETTLPALVEAALTAEPDRDRQSAATSIRRLVSGLALYGHVEVVLPPVPDLFAGRYTRVRELGRGGVGVVWLCEDTAEDNALVVVKHAWNWAGPLEPRDGSIREEAAILARLDHPQVVQLVDTFEVDGRYHMVRAYVEGEELGTYAMDAHELGPDERIAFTRHAAGVLSHLHARDVLCLDVKPSNFMVTGANRPLILSDVGHCRPLEDGRAKLPSAWGTEGFAAPEVMRDHVATKRSDVYGLGAFLAFLILRREPRASWQREELLHRLEAQGATEEERRLVDACCREDPDRRPASVERALRLLDAR